jgi:hypothetical protein
MIIKKYFSIMVVLIMVSVVIFGCSNANQTKNSTTNYLPTIPPKSTADSLELSSKNNDEIDTKKYNEEDIYLAVSYSSKSADFGYINEAGAFVIEAKFEQAQGFSANGLAPAMNHGKLWGFIDTSGTYIIEPQYHELRRFSNGMAAVGMDYYNKTIWGYINEKGDWAIKIGEPKYYGANEFAANGLAAVSLGPDGGSYRFIDKTGQFACGGKGFRDVTSFSTNGLAGAQIYNDTLWGYIDQTGEFVIKEQFSHAGPFSENGYAIVRDEKDEHSGIINSSGKWIVTIQDNIYLNYFSNFTSNGLALFNNCLDYTEGLYGYIDESGKIVITPKFDYASVFTENGLAKVGSAVNNTVGYINKLGNYVIKPTLNQSFDFYKAN